MCVKHEPRVPVVSVKGFEVRSNRSRRIYSATLNSIGFGLLDISEYKSECPDNKGSQLSYFNRLIHLRVKKTLLI